jgi:hypothetical protein
MISHASLHFDIRSRSSVPLVGSKYSLQLKTHNALPNLVGSFILASSAVVTDLKIIFKFHRKDQPNVENGNF